MYRSSATNRKQRKRIASIRMSYKYSSKWMELDRHGDLIEDLFLPLKTPWMNDLESFSETEFAMICQDYNIGLVLNLAAKKYYDFALFKQQFGGSIVHEHKPLLRDKDNHLDQTTVEEIMYLIDDFRKKNPKKRIAICCTLGLNRTGHVICSYLVTRMKYDIENAIQTYGRNRIPGIIQACRLEDLIKNFCDEVKTAAIMKRQREYFLAIAGYDIDQK